MEAISKQLSSSDDVDKVFIELKVQTREKECKLFVPKFLDLCVCYFGQSPESQKCFINCSLQAPNVTSEFLNQTYGEIDNMSRILKHYYSIKPADAFLILRILFIISATRPGISDRLCKDEEFIRHLLNAYDSCILNYNQEVIHEIHRLLFNLTTHVSPKLLRQFFSGMGKLMQSFNKLLPNDESINIVQYIFTTSFEDLKPFLAPPFDSLISLFMHVDQDSLKQFNISDKFFFILSALFIVSLKNKSDITTSLVMSLNHFITMSASLRDILKKMLLPADMDRTVPLNIGNHYYNHLLRSLTETFDDDLRRCIEEFIWNLCGNDPNRVVYYCGYGNSAGLLMKQGFMKLPQINQKSTTDEGERLPMDNIDPMTGQLLEYVRRPELTEAEAEEEAERLVQVFEKLHKLGVVSQLNQ